MAPLLMPISSLLVGVALLLLGSGLLNTLLALRSEIEGFSGTTLGLIMSGYFIGFFVGTFLALPLIRRVGHIRAFAFCAALVASSVLMHTIVVSPISWLVIRIFTGLALVILYTVIESWLNGQTPSEQRGKVFAIYMTVNLGALALAQQLIRLDKTLSFGLFALAAMLICFSVLPVTWTRMQQPNIHDISRMKLRALYRVAPTALIAATLSGLAMGAFWGMSALYASRVGLSNTQVATFMSCAILGGALFQFPLGRYSDKHDRRKVLASISVAAAVVAGVVGLVAGYTPLTFIVIAIYGGLAFAIYPIAVAHMVDHLAPENMLSGGGSMLLLHGIGAMLGPLVAGQLMQFSGSVSLPLYWAFMHGLLALAAIMFSRRGAVENPAEHSADFVPMVRTTPTAFELLPEDAASRENDDATSVWGGQDGSHEDIAAPISETDGAETASR